MKMFSHCAFSPRPVWRRISPAMSAAMVLLVAGCATTTRPPAQPVRPPLTNPKAKPPPPTEGAVMPGVWRFAATPGGMISSFDGAGPGQAGLVRFVCEPRSRRLTLSYPGIAGRVDLIATSGARSYSARDLGAGRAGVELSPEDPQMDALIFSRGQFVVRPAGGVSLTLPARSELARVVEDCRTAR